MGFPAPSRPAGPADDLGSRVLLLANANDPDSVRIARHYAACRGVPAANVIVLAMPERETITWQEFVPEIWEPLIARLVRDHWLDAIAMNLTDEVGRRKFAVHSHRIAALVACRGVPLRIANEPGLYRPNPPFTRRAEFHTNAAAVDAELALLPLPNHPIAAFVPNPLFQNEHPTDHEEQQVVKVSRLDGPTAADALALIDHAIAAEHDGLLGRAYVDLSDRDPLGNGWLETTAARLRDLAFDTDVDQAAATLGPAVRFDAPVLYFGWYEGNVNGPFTLPGFRFPPGAIALHIHSYSATTLRSATTGWTGPFIARGVTATVGNVNEPYLQLTHRPNLLLRALSRGATLVDAAYFALQALSWQEVLIGDPLYRPFAVSLDQQLARRESLPRELASYAVIRRAIELEHAGRRLEGIDLLQRSLHETPSLSVGYALAQRFRAAGERGRAADALRSATRGKSFAAGEWGLAREVAAALADCGQPADAVPVWQALFSSPDFPRELRESWLTEAAAAARAAGDAAQAEAWDREKDRLTAPVPAG